MRKNESAYNPLPVSEIITNGWCGYENGTLLSDNLNNVKTRLRGLDTDILSFGMWEQGGYSAIANYSAPGPNTSTTRIRTEVTITKGNYIIKPESSDFAYVWAAFDSNGNLIYKRKSPKKENIYSVFKQITGLTEILLHKNFSLEIIEISVTEVRTKTEQPVQTQNKSRHHLRTWIKTDKLLNQIHKTYIFKTAEDYLNLLPQFKLNSNRNDFTVKQTQKLLENIKNLKNAKTSASIMIWVLKKMDLIEEIYKEKREIHYKIR